MFTLGYIAVAALFAAGAALAGKGVADRSGIDESDSLMEKATKFNEQLAEDLEKYSKTHQKK